MDRLFVELQLLRQKKSVLLLLLAFILVLDVVWDGGRGSGGCDVVR